VEQLRVLETELRQASGRLEEMKRTVRDLSNDLEYGKPQIIRIAAAALTEAWSSKALNEDAVSEVVRNSLIKTVEEHAQLLRRRIDGLAQKLDATLRSTAKALEVEHMPGEQELLGLVREMPAFDFVKSDLHLTKPLFLRLFGNAATVMLGKRLERIIGPRLQSALLTYRALLYDWSERILTQMERRFDAYASGYRAQISRSIGSPHEPVAQSQAILRDLETLEVPATVAS
jgi:hypothetical protein